MTETSISAVIAATFADEANSTAPDEGAPPPASADPKSDEEAQFADAPPTTKTAERADASASRVPTKAKTSSDSSKTDVVLKKLRMARGVTIAQIRELTGWQAHSVRGFLSAVVRKKLGLNLVNEVGKDGQRRYRVAGASTGSAQEG
jgi:hypothetical protein